MKKILFLICMALVLFWVSLAPVKAAEDNTFKLNLSYMPVSRHWDRERLVSVFDDRQQVVDMWRRNNITCFQCAKGDF